jgi:hypothetical protein
MTPATIEREFASDEARELAEQHPDLKLPAKGSAAEGKLNVSDVRKAVAEANPDADAASSSSSRRGWGSKGYDGKQPWEDGGPKHEPIVHGKPQLTSGSDGQAVIELGARLNALGYESSLSRGENPFAILDESVLDAVRAFRRDHGVREDPRGYTSESDADNHVGPFTWEALLAATE